MKYKKSRNKPKINFVLKQKTALRAIAVTASFAVALAIGLFVYFNISGSKKSLAKQATSSATAKPVDFNVPELKSDYKSQEINGIKVRKLITEPASND
jgi:hypothetical protein